MGAFWTAFVAGTTDTAAHIAGDLLPVLAVLAGLALAERVIRMILSAGRG